MIVFPEGRAGRARDASFYDGAFSTTPLRCRSGMGSSQPERNHGPSAGRAAPAQGDERALHVAEAEVAGKGGPMIGPQTAQLVSPVLIPLQRAIAEVFCPAAGEELLPEVVDARLSTARGRPAGRAMFVPSWVGEKRRTRPVRSAGAEDLYGADDASRCGDRDP
jgi:hypothetical protein